MNRNSYINLNNTIRDCIECIEKNRQFIAPVVSDFGKLLGVVSDGDIRRAILSNYSLDTKVDKIMTTTPIVAEEKLSSDDIYELMSSNNVAAVPLVDKNNKFVKIIQMEQLKRKFSKINSNKNFWAAVIMAGGEGKRLRPITENQPKPLLKIGGIPLIERQVKDLVKSGIKNIFISTNYLGHMIEDHFKDGKNFGAKIFYLKEKHKLGTIGSLSLLNKKPEGSMVILNGDILTKSDYTNLFLYHHQNKNLITISAVKYKFRIPFGVIKQDNYKVLSIEEKPEETFYVMQVFTLFLRML